MLMGRGRRGLSLRMGNWSDRRKSPSVPPTPRPDQFIAKAGLQKAGRLTRAAQGQPRNLLWGGRGRF